MSTVERRHRGRAIRRNRSRYPGTGLVFVEFGIEAHSFMLAVERAAKALDAFSRAYKHPRQILHNGRKPR